MKTIQKYVSVKRFTHGGKLYTIGEVFSTEDKKLNKTDLTFLLDTERIQKFGTVTVPDVKEEVKVDEPIDIFVEEKVETIEEKSKIVPEVIEEKAEEAVVEKVKETVVKKEAPKHSVKRGRKSK